ncbi:MAG: DEAD/DEAH box helicase [Leptolyngbya sp. PLA2]|nr:ATP-dependent helicase [Leptolyngbya sp.]MCE7971415.1 DEAD/DEAH box helicase [Leptolyngbya sp. PL-A2]MCQ3940630.1 ATP-dependent helicase [cyanobacterium CYA1]MDL1903600.1 DEAD/DEAH box helicase [Synechococcales cyanobacterium CNB]GIK20072.1 MAG: helicase HelZ [Planctomycetota bacterium]
MLIVHGVWAGGSVRLWAESARLWPLRAAASDSAHPFAAAADELARLLPAASPEPLRVLLPSLDSMPEPSPRLAHAVGHESEESGFGLRAFEVAALRLPADRVEDVLERLAAREAGEGLVPGESVEWFAATVRFARHLRAQERFVPMLLQDSNGALRASWSPWLADEQASSRAVALARAMPPAARCAEAEQHLGAWGVLEALLGSLTDAACRRTLVRESMAETLDGTDRGDPQAAWLDGLLGESSAVAVAVTVRAEVVRRVRTWVGALDERGTVGEWRLCLRLEEPMESSLLDDMRAPPESVEWRLGFALRSAEDERISIEAEDVWLLPTESVTVEGRRVDGVRELLLGELGRASRLYRPIERALEDSEPVELRLTTSQAYQFLREVAPILREQGFGVVAPDWWESPAMRLGARMRLTGGQPRNGDRASPSPAGPAALGLGALVHYEWEISVGDRTLSLHEFERLARERSPLLRVGGRWVEVRPEDVEAAIRFIRENPGGETSLGDALRLAYASDTRRTGLNIVGLEAEGWLGALLGGESERRTLPTLTTPETFHGVLRPYQQRGLAWLSFMESHGFGICLADDMGLGKTIQLLALLAHEREVSRPKEERGEAAETPASPEAAEPIGPTLLVVPMSVVGNWVREARRFCPSLRVLLHHGLDRLTGAALHEKALASDVVVTTYALAHRDREQLECIGWRRVVLDEAQYVKNPQSKQAQAVRAFESPRRAALTGTPVENRLSELWSIMDFLNPGYLGGASSFRRQFGVPIERYHDHARGEKLRSLIRPFVLRRLKTDPSIIADLPDKLESREFSHLTREQAEMYRECVARMMGEVERAEGIHRRGLVLAALVKLKQICNHPAQALKDHDFAGAAPPDPSRSGKCVRLLEMLDETLAAGDRSLVFTQFRQMGHLLALMLRHELDRDVLFLHGGTTQKQREAMIEQFHEPGGRHPIMILSLKAGGVGLNLTAATHVFHFDRWWNPAVEQQATDRAFRIGQTRTVQVHKFVVRGTLEERIDEMIEAKTELAERIVGSGERWLTELSTDDLRGILTLRDEAVGVDE